MATKALWAIKTPRGRVAWETVQDTEAAAWYEAVGTIRCFPVVSARRSTRSPLWYPDTTEAKRRGYRAVRVRVVEEAPDADE